MLRRAALVSSFFWSFAIACGSSTTSSSPSGTDGGATNDSGGATSAADVCSLTRTFVERCAGELNCGDEFDTWCTANDAAINSEAYRKAEAKCLPSVECTAKARSACEYASYGANTPTAAQKALVAAYCQTCEPNDVPGCSQRSITYDPAGEVTDIFIAAWELADPIVDQIREKCTGAALPDGAEPCASRFASCASGPYLDAVPNCP